ncbi:MAG: peptidase S41 [Lutibacter sp.]|nr:MAG: peptidase S41 [Lutibacter sp.]
MKKFIIFLLFFATTSILFSQSNPLINTPTLNPDGTIIAFNYQGDLWTVLTNGQNLKRLTIHEGFDENPTWSKDGKTLAFESDRYGNKDIFTIPVNGGTPKRITFHSSSDYITDFTVDNSILFNTSRNFAQVEREREIHSVSVNGGTPKRFLDAVGFDAVMSPNNKFVAFTRGTCRIEREAYKGAANRDIWIYNTTNDTYHQATTFNGQDLAPKWANNSTLLFQSARDGVYNIHELKIDTNGQKTGIVSAITNLKKMGLSSFDLSSNGNDIVMIAGDKVSLIDRTTKAKKTLNIEINSDYRFDPTERKTYSNKATEIEVSPNGKLSAFVVRGEVFITQNDTEKSKTVNLTNSPARDLDIGWLNDEALFFISDRNGIKNLYMVSSNDPKNKNIFTSLKHTSKQVTKSKQGVKNARLAPNGKSISYIEGTKLVVSSITKDGDISNKKILKDYWDTPSNVSWSPDSKWLAYSLTDLNFNHEIFIHKVDGTMNPVNVSMHPKGDYEPTWSADGSKLAFSSNRNNGDYDVWFVWLNKKDWEKTKEDWDETDDDTDIKKDKKTENKDDEKEEIVADIIIDFDDIHERQEQVTSFTGSEFVQAFSKDGKTIFYTTGNGSRGNPDVENDLFKINWDGKEKKSLTKGNTNPRSISLNSKYSHLYFVEKGKLARIKIADSKKESLPFSAKMIIDYKAESDQIFEEAWDVIEKRFYDPNHHGQNWKTLKNTYKPLAMKASTRADFKKVFNTMLGQINASHMGLYRGEDRKSVQKEKTGILGLEFEPLNNGSVKITSVVINSAADREANKLNVGDIITSIDGEKLTKTQNIYELLNGTAGSKIILEVISNEVTKEVVIRPKSSARTDNYNAWVKERKRLTAKYSNNRLGYIHIRGMNWTSFERFERELTAAGYGKEGVVIDVRYNGGGWTTDYLMAVLNVKQHAYTVPRGAAKNLEKENKNFKNNYPFSERLPLASWTKPSIALCNQNSYSNAEIFSHAYKELGLGKLVGVPTFGAVISTGGQTLIDGSYVRVPFRGWYVKSSEKNMDFHPAVPDIIVSNNPDDKAKGKDTQLKRAVDELLKDL